MGRCGLGGLLLLILPHTVRPSKIELSLLFFFSLPAAAAAADADTLFDGSRFPTIAGPSTFRSTSTSTHGFPLGQMGMPYSWAKCPRTRLWSMPGCNSGQSTRCTSEWAKEEEESADATSLN